MLQRENIWASKAEYITLESKYVMEKVNISIIFLFSELFTVIKE